MATVVGQRMRMEGNQQIASILNKMPDRIQNKVMTAAVNSGARVIRTAALANVKHRLSGLNRFGVLSSKAVVQRKAKNSSKQNPRVVVANHPSYFYLHILEIGAAAPSKPIVPRRNLPGKAGRNARNRGDPKALYIPGYGPRASASPKAQPPRPWMRPAWDANKRKAQDTMAKNLGRGLLREAQRLSARVGYTGKRRRRRR